MDIRVGEIRVKVGEMRVEDAQFLAARIHDGLIALPDALPASPNSRPAPLRIETYGGESIEDLADRIVALILSEIEG